jgi:tetratricopeptide (TPR) repeat protein
LSCISLENPYLTYDRISYWENGDILFTDVIEKYPNFPFAYSNRGYLYFDHYAMKTYKETNPQQFIRYMDLALSDYNNAISLDTSFVSPRVNKAVLLYNYGQFQNDTVKYHAALKDFTIALKLQPKNKDALLGRANTLGTLQLNSKLKIITQRFLFIIKLCNAILNTVNPIHGEDWQNTKYRIIKVQ